MPSPERGHRILILVPGKLGERLSGPEIRAVRLGQALAVENRVTLIAPGAAGEHEGLPVAPFSRRRLLREARRHDVVIASTVPPFLLALKRRLRFVAVSDQYDPVELELGTLEQGADRARVTARAARRLQLSCADLVLCAGQRQRQLLEAEIETLDTPRRPPLCTVPFGIDEDAPASGDSPLRSHFAQIEEGDSVVLWWGSLWRWLDAETAIRAIATLRESRPEVKLVFTAGKAPNGAADRHSALTEARALAAELGVLDRSVLFLDEWVPFARRGDYIRDADVGLTLHRDSEEASLAARARYMDYLWSGLPCVLGRGDEAAERFEQAGFASLVETGSPEATAAALLALLEPQARLRAAAAGRDLAEEMRWRRVTTPLVKALRAIEPDAAPVPASPQLRRTTSYYARRLGDRLLPSA